MNNALDAELRNALTPAICATMKPLTAVIFIILLAGCASHESHSIPQISIEKNGRLMSEPTPSAWAVGSVWNFVQSPNKDAAVLDVTFRVTNKPAQTCSSGDWRQLEIVAGKIGDGSVQLKQAYSVSGRLLTLDLTGGCDFGEIQGALRDATFLGQTTGGPVTDGKIVPQRVVGRKVR